MRAELFGQPIVKSSRLSYVQQVYDILCREIHRMRWRVDDRLPGVIDLANQAGLGVKTIQAAYAMLKEDGYVRTESRKGSYLNSLFPQQENPEGVIGILLAEGQDENPVFVYYLHALQRVSLQCQCVVEIEEAEASTVFSTVHDLCQRFRSDVKGVVMLSPFTVLERDEAARPFVYLGFQSYDVWPLVAVDVQATFYDLTKRVIRQGHEDILFARGVHLEDGMSKLISTGFEKAMAEHGLPTVDCYVEGAASIHNALQSRDIADHRAPTAIVCSSLRTLTEAHNAARDLGLAIPRDLSLVTIGSRMLGKAETGPRSTGAVMDDMSMAKRCFDLLLNDASPRTSRLLLLPEFVPGDTLAPPGSNA